MLPGREQENARPYLITGNDEFAEEVIGKVAEILGRRHRMAMAEDEPGDARVVLYVAHSFADELAAAREDFDRERFIEAIVEEPFHT
jgi:hypothetical protein